MSKRLLGWCYLCARWSELTDEDVVSTWVRRVLKTMHDPTHDLPPRYLMPLCGPCNNALGNQFENPAAPILKPLIRGETVTLTPQQQKIVASWAVMKDYEFAMARDVFFTADGPVVASPRERERYRPSLVRLMMDGVPDPNTSVRIGTVGFTTSPDLTPFIPRDWDREWIFMSSLNPIGLLVVEGVEGGGSTDIADFIAHTASDDRLTRIWPPLAHDVTIRPTLGAPDADRLRDELGHRRDNIVGGGFRLLAELADPHVRTSGGKAADRD